MRLTSYDVSSELRDKSKPANPAADDAAQEVPPKVRSTTKV